MPNQYPELVKKSQQQSFGTSFWRSEKNSEIQPLLRKRKIFTKEKRGQNILPFASGDPGSTHFPTRLLTRI